MSRSRSRRSRRSRPEVSQIEYEFLREFKHNQRSTADVGSDMELTPYQSRRIVRRLRDAGLVTTRQGGGLTPLVNVSLRDVRVVASE